MMVARPTMMMIMMMSAARPKWIKIFLVVTRRVAMDKITPADRAVKGPSWLSTAPQASWDKQEMTAAGQTRPIAPAHVKQQIELASLNNNQNVHLNLARQQQAASNRSYSSSGSKSKQQHLSQTKTAINKHEVTAAAATDESLSKTNGRTGKGEESEDDEGQHIGGSGRGSIGGDTITTANGSAGEESHHLQLVCLVVGASPPAKIVWTRTESSLLSQAHLVGGNGKGIGNDTVESGRPRTAKQQAAKQYKQRQQQRAPMNQEGDSTFVYPDGDSGNNNRWLLVSDGGRETETIVEQSTVYSSLSSLIDSDGKWPSSSQSAEGDLPLSAAAVPLDNPLRQWTSVKVLDIDTDYHLSTIECRAQSGHALGGNPLSTSIKLNITHVPQVNLYRAAARSEGGSDKDLREAIVTMNQVVEFVCQISFANPPLSEPIGWYLDDDALDETSSGQQSKSSRLMRVISRKQENFNKYQFEERLLVQVNELQYYVGIDIDKNRNKSLYCKARNALGTSTSKPIQLIFGRAPHCLSNTSNSATATSGTTTVDRRYIGSSNSNDGSQRDIETPKGSSNNIIKNSSSDNKNEQQLQFVVKPFDTRQQQRRQSSTSSLTPPSSTSDKDYYYNSKNTKLHFASSSDHHQTNSNSNSYSVHCPVIYDGVKSAHFYWKINQTVVAPVQHYYEGQPSEHQNIILAVSNEPAIPIWRLFERINTSSAAGDHVNSLYGSGNGANIYELMSKVVCYATDMFGSNEDSPCKISIEDLSAPVTHAAPCEY